VSTPYRLPPGSPVPEPTSWSAAVVADTIVRTVELGATITDAAVDGDTTVVFCTLLDDGQCGCPGCGIEGRYRDTVIRTVTDVPVVGHPLRLRVRVPRYRCVNTACEREVFAHNTDRLARRGWSTTFAYPFGAFDAVTPELVRSAGFERACSTANDLTRASSDIMLLPRAPARNYSGRLFSARLRLESLL